MFHWICPECGQEIAPGVKECPVCEPHASASSVPSGGQPNAAIPVAAKPAPVAASAPLLERLAPAVALYAQQPTPAAPQPAPVVQQPTPAVQTPVVQHFAVQQPVQESKVVLQPEVLVRPDAILQAKAF